MFEPTTYEITIRGRAGARVLHPLLDDFVCEHVGGGDGGQPGQHGGGRHGEGVTRLVGVVHDPAHLHGVVAHLTSMNAELISIAPLTATTQSPTTANPTIKQEWTTTP